MIFLHGGGDHPDSRADTFGRFVQAALAHSDGPLALAAAANTTDEAQPLAEEYLPSFQTLDVPAREAYAAWIGALIAEYASY